jgi:hypothetical protein
MKHSQQNIQYIYIGLGAGDIKLQGISEARIKPVFLFASYYRKKIL